jgi:hypothetical protein
MDLNGTSFPGMECIEVPYDSVGCDCFSGNIFNNMLACRHALIRFEPEMKVFDRHTFVHYELCMEICDGHIPSIVKFIRK